MICSKRNINPIKQLSKIQRQHRVKKDYFYGAMKLIISKKKELQ